MFSVFILDSSAISVRSFDLNAELIFDPVSQKLVRIRMKLNASPENIPVTESSIELHLIHADKELYGNEARHDCRRLVANFPPTTLGSYCESDLSYKMEFKSGICFSIKIDTPDHFHHFQSKMEHPVLNGDYSPLIDTIDVYDPTHVDQQAFCETQYEIYVGESVKMIRRQNATDAPQFAWLRLGAGLQDILSSLGPPDDICGDFYNFFDFGIAVKIDRTRCGNVEKFIIQCNHPGHIQFGRYNRAGFEVILQERCMHAQEGTSAKASQVKSHSEGGSGPEKGNADETDDDVTGITSESTLDGLQQTLGNAGQPLVVNNPFTSQVQYFYTYPTKGLSFELTPAGIIASVQVM